MDALRLFFAAVFRLLFPPSRPRPDRQGLLPIGLVYGYVTDMAATAGYLPIGPAAQSALLAVPAPGPPVSAAVDLPPDPDPPNPPPRPEPPSADPADDVLRILPAKLGVARFLFGELWSRCGGEPGEIGPVTIAEMIAWRPEFTESKIRKAIQKLAAGEYGYIAVQNLGARGQKRILVNRPTRIVRETPLFDYAAGRGGHGGDGRQIGRDGREGREEIRPNPPKSTETPEIKAVEHVLPSAAELDRKRREQLDRLQNREKIDFSHNQEEDISLYIKNNQEVKKSRNQEPDQPLRVSRADFRTSNRQGAPDKPSRSPPTRNGPSVGKGPESLSGVFSGLRTAILSRPRKNTAGMRIRRDEIIGFVESHWPPCPHEKDRRLRWLVARRVAVCAVDLENDGPWEKKWRPGALAADHFGRYCSRYVQEVCRVREMDLESIDAIGREVITQTVNE